MDKSSLFSALSLVSVFIYMYIGFYTFSQNKKSIEQLVKNTDDLLYKAKQNGRNRIEYSD